MNHVTIKTSEYELKASGDSAEAVLVDALCKILPHVRTKPIAEHPFRVGDRVSFQHPTTVRGCRVAGVVVEAFERSVTVETHPVNAYGRHTVGVTECDVQAMTE